MGLWTRAILLSFCMAMPAWAEDETDPTQPERDVVHETELNFELNFLDGFMFIVDAVDVGFAVNSIVRCTTEACFNTNVGLLVMQIAGRHMMRAMAAKLQDKPGAHLFNDQIDRQVFLDFLDQLEKFGIAISAEPAASDDIRKQAVTALVEKFRPVSRQLNAFDHAAWGNVFAQLLRRAIVTAVDEDRKLLRHALSEMASANFADVPSERELKELQKTAMQLDALSTLPGKLHPGFFVYALLMSTTAVQNYLYIPQLIPHALYLSLGRTYIGRQIAAGAAAMCKHYVCVVNAPISKLLGVAQTIDHAYFSFKSDLARDWAIREAQMNGCALAMATK